jgi:hypothetical protein
MAIDKAIYTLLFKFSIVEYAVTNVEIENIP